MCPDETRSAPLPAVPSAESTFREVNGLSLHVVAAGDPADPLVVLLHGFPEFWYGWRAYVEPLVSAGYRVLVPDQRGYNRSDKPEGVRPYRIGQLSGDIAALVGTEDRDHAHVVGHDWGAGVAWDLALRHPRVVDRLGIVNAPHPVVFEQTLRSNPRQLRKSWYMGLFQLPSIPERVLRRNDYDWLVSAMRDSARPDAFDSEAFDCYRRAWARPGALAAMVNWYRALLRHRTAPPRERVDAPTLVLWGEDDRALLAAMADESATYCESSRVERFPEATHWVLHEYPDRVTELLVEHLDT